MMFCSRCTAQKATELCIVCARPVCHDCLYPVGDDSNACSPACAIEAPREKDGPIATLVADAIIFGMSVVGSTLGMAMRLVTVSWVQRAQARLFKKTPM